MLILMLMRQCNFDSAGMITQLCVLHITPR